MQSTSTIRRRKAAGECVSCGVKLTNGKRQCDECLRIRRAKVDTRKASGLCIQCGASVSGNKMCDKCASVAKTTNARRKAAGLCRICGVPAENGRVMCEKHLAEQRQRHHERKAAGLCSTCGKPLDTENSHCFTCWLRNRATSHLGSSKLWPVLLGVWNKQGGICPYTGEVLVPGRNASLDHITPVARGGSNDPDNLEWISTRVNIAKSDMTRDEFIAFVRSLANRLPSI